MLRLNFFSKLLMAFIFIGIVPLSIVGFFSYSILTNSLKHMISAQAYDNVVKISEHIDILNSEYGEIIIGLLRGDELIRNALIKGTKKDSDLIHRKILVMAGRKNTGVFIINATGSLIFGTHQLPDFYNPQDIRSRSFFREMDSRRNGYVIYPRRYINPTGDSVIYNIARAIRDDTDKIIGYIIIEIYKNHLIEIYNDFNTTLNLDIAVLNYGLDTIADLRNPLDDGTLYARPYRERIKAGGSGSFIENYKEQQRLVVFHTSKYSQLIVVGEMPFALILANSDFIKWVTVLTCIISLVICIFLAVLVTKNLSRPIKNLVACMKQVEKGDLSVKADYNSWDELGVLGKSFNKMIAQIKELLAKVVEEQNQLREYEIKALQAQINPHFLYNTLDSIKWLVKMNGIDAISKIVTQLGKLLRSSISYDGEMVSVAASIKNIESYLYIQKIRHSDKFEIKFQIDPEINECQIPKLILQPLVENAILHGLENKIGKGTVTINGFPSGNQLIFEIIDDGIGIEAEKVKAINSGRDLQSSSASIGIQNVNRRIKLYYGEEYGLQIESQKNVGTKIILKMPLVAPTEGRTNVQDRSS